MTKIEKNIFINQDFKEIIENAKVEYHSDISWAYIIQTEKYDIAFSQNEEGKNSIDTFSICANDFWFDVTPTNFQIKTMFEKLNNTQYQGVEEFSDPVDLWLENGVCEANFY